MTVAEPLHTIDDPVSGGGESTERRLVVYCVVPRDLAPRIYEPLRDHFRTVPDVEVVVERRRGDRRGRATRRAPRARKAAARSERRRVRSASGRRIGERRALTSPLQAARALPRRARRYAHRLTFIERVEPSAQQLRDAESKRLVVRFQSGDRAVFSELYLRYFNAVYSYARVALSDHHEAEDVTQQVFISALQALDDYELRPSVPFRGWLFVIARHKVLRAVSLRRGLVLDTPDQIDLMREEAHADADATARTLDWLSDQEVALFVERLPLAQRQVLVLRFMLDLSSEEIAEVLGRSTSSVRQLQSRALQLLERRLHAIGRSSSRDGLVPVRRRFVPHTVIVRRRFALAHAAGQPRVPA